MSDVTACPRARTISSVSEEMGITASATTQLADRLERAGLVERTACESDRRQKILSLTRHGSDLMRSRRTGRVRCAARVLERMPPADRQKLIDAARSVLDAADGRTEDEDETGPCRTGRSNTQPTARFPVVLKSPDSKTV